MTLSLDDLPKDTWERVYAILNAACGDVLKAQVLNDMLGMTLDFSRMPLPKGETSALFSALKHGGKPKAEQMSRTIPPVNPVSPHMIDQTRLSSVPTPVFEDIDPVEEVKKNGLAPVRIAEEDGLSPGEYLHEGEIWCDLSRVLEILEVSLPTAYNWAAKDHWKKTEHPHNRRGKIYLRSDVEKSADDRKDV